jgi:hypothetical protein
MRVIYDGVFGNGALETWEVFARTRPNILNSKRELEPFSGETEIVKAEDDEDDERNEAREIPEEIHDTLSSINDAVDTFGSVESAFDALENNRKCLRSAIHALFNQGQSLNGWSVAKLEKQLSVNDVVALLWKTAMNTKDIPDGERAETLGMLEIVVKYLKVMLSNRHEGKIELNDTDHADLLKNLKTLNEKASPPVPEVSFDFLIRACWMIRVC